MVLTVMSTSGIRPFQETFPDKYLDIGIAEQNMVGVAGLASEGYRHH